jgi:hypothetical protein
LAIGPLFTVAAVPALIAGVGVVLLLATRSGVRRTFPSRVAPAAEGALR